MRHLLSTCAALMLFLSGNAQAVSPSVSVDIAPLHSLVTQVMEDVGKPTLLIPAGASPHHYSLKPSEAKALESADVVFWIGKRLSPWLGKALDNLSDSAEKVAVLHVEGTSSYPARTGANFEKHTHDDDHHGEEEGHHDGKEDEHHKEETGHDDGHKEEHDEHDATNDPHVWLDPANAKVWVKVVSETLSKKDPANAATYSRNAAKAIANLDELIKTTQTQIKVLGNPQYIVFHDAYQYFEKRFGISAAGSIKLGDAADPSPARIKEVQAIVKRLGVTCVFTEPQFNPDIIKTVFDGTSVTSSGVMDPLGASLARGGNLYQELIEGMVKSLSLCK